MKLFRDIAERAVGHDEHGEERFGEREHERRQRRPQRPNGSTTRLAVIKGAIASKVGGTGTAALLPASEG